MLRSLRARLILGSVLWTLGLLSFVHLLSVVLMYALPGMRGGVSHHMMIVIGAVLATVGVLLVRGSVKQFTRLRAHLAAVREGEAQRVDGDYFTEVQPLVNDLNALLEHRERVVRRALATAGDLAHGLKTPLAILTQEAARLEAAGQHEIASVLDQQVQRMRRQVDYHLAHARAAGSGAAPGAARASVLASAEALARTLLRLHAERGLAIRVDVAPEHSVRCEREDLDELLGNLLDNACKWARAEVVASSEVRDGFVHVLVDDDGPGLDPSMRERVLQRGVRADEAAPGSGLGLAIVRELAELYGGSIALEDAPRGGLRARLRLPSGI